MPLDMNALMMDPMFQFGIGMLGGSGPGTSLADTAKGGLLGLENYSVIKARKEKAALEKLRAEQLKAQIEDARREARERLRMQEAFMSLLGKPGTPQEGPTRPGESLPNVGASGLWKTNPGLAQIMSTVPANQGFDAMMRYYNYDAGRDDEAHRRLMDQETINWRETESARDQANKDRTFNADEEQFWLNYSLKLDELDAKTLGALASDDRTSAQKEIDRLVKRGVISKDEGDQILLYKNDPRARDEIDRKIRMARLGVDPMGGGMSESDVDSVLDAGKRFEQAFSPPSLPPISPEQQRQILMNKLSNPEYLTDDELNALDELLR